MRLEAAEAQAAREAARADAAEAALKELQGSGQQHRSMREGKQPLTKLSLRLFPKMKHKHEPREPHGLLNSLLLLKAILSCPNRSSPVLHAVSRVSYLVLW